VLEAIHGLQQSAQLRHQCFDHQPVGLDDRGVGGQR
jgi:hypothetical protein